MTLVLGIVRSNRELLSQVTKPVACYRSAVTTGCITKFVHIELCPLTAHLANRLETLQSARIWI